MADDRINCKINLYPKWNGEQINEAKQAVLNTNTLDIKKVYMGSFPLIFGKVKEGNNFEGVRKKLNNIKAVESVEFS